MIRAGALFALCAAGLMQPANAQCYSGCPQVLTQSDLATLCQPASVVPPSETVGGAGGSAGTCRRSDAVQPRITRAGLITTDANGQWTITWSSALVASPVTLPIPMLPLSSTQPIICLPITSTATGATGRCWYARPLPAALTVISGLASYDVFGSNAANISVQMLAIPVTQ